MKRKDAKGRASKRRAEKGQATVEYAISAAAFAALAFLGGRLLTALLQALRFGALNAAIAPGRDF